MLIQKHWKIYLGINYSVSWSEALTRSEKTVKLAYFDNIEEILSEKNLAFVLENPSDFKNMEYKILKNQGYSWVANVFHCSFNGHPELFYLVEKYQKITEVIPNLEKEQIIRAVEQVCAHIREIKTNSFLSRDSLILDEQNIFYDLKSHTVIMIYFPVQSHEGAANQSFYADLYNLIIWMLSVGDCRSVVGQLETFKNTNGYFPDEDQVTDMIEKYREDNLKCQFDFDSPRNELILEPVVGTTLRIVINTDSYFIGRKNIVPPGGGREKNRLVGRAHCIVERRDCQFYVRDLDSLNGTYVNRKRLMGSEEELLHAGDKLRIANVVFEVKIEQEDHGV